MSDKQHLLTCLSRREDERKRAVSSFVFLSADLAKGQAKGGSDAYTLFLTTAAFSLMALVYGTVRWMQNTQ